MPGQQSNFIKLLGVVLFSLLGTSCTTKTEVYEAQVNKEFKNGETIFVKRKDEVSRSYGAISGHLWGETHNFRYQFLLEPSEVSWEGVLRETPKEVLFCEEGLFLKTVTEQVQTDTVTQATKIIGVSGFYKNIDKRFFFKMFGDQYFVVIDSLEYMNIKTKCPEEHVPNL